MQLQCMPIVMQQNGLWCGHELRWRADGYAGWRTGFSGGASGSLGVDITASAGAGFGDTQPGSNTRQMGTRYFNAWDPSQAPGGRSRVIGCLGFPSESECRESSGDSGSDAGPLR